MQKPLRKIKKQQENLQTPPILKVTEPTGSEDGSTTDEVTVSSIYFRQDSHEAEAKEQIEWLSSDSTSLGVSLVKEPHQRRVTYPLPVDHPDKRKASLPPIRLPEKVEYSEKSPGQYEDLTTYELERRKREYKPKQSATADYASLREGGATFLLDPSQPKMPKSAPVSLFTTPTSSRSNSPKRHIVSCVCKT